MAWRMQARLFKGCSPGRDLPDSVRAWDHGLHRYVRLRVDGGVSASVFMRVCLCVYLCVCVCVCVAQVCVFACGWGSIK
jgi:hypothetical protein